MKISSKQYADKQMRWMLRLHTANTRAMRRAVDKVQEDYKYYKEQQNEWRQQSKDQTSTYVTRRELVGAIVSAATISSAIAGFVAWIIQRA